MEEKVFDVEMIYIQNTSGSDFSVECISRRSKTVKLNFSNVDGIELNATRPLELKSSFLRIGENDNKIWNLKFNYPVNLNIKYTGKITIETI